jgi:hypothetical protein
MGFAIVHPKSLLTWSFDLFYEEKRKQRRKDEGGKLYMPGF